MNLIIVESPTKARTLGRFLKKDYTILASMGHVRDLPKKKLAVDVDNDFKPTYVVVADKEEAIAKLKQAALKAKKIILATDPDREGEAIAYHVSQLLKAKDKSSRIVFHEITRSAIERALESPSRINLKLVEAQQARRILDRLFGYKLSPLLWSKVRRGLSAGRVQSPAVRLIVEREREIKQFKPAEFWLINVKLRKKDKKQAFLAKLLKEADKKIEIKSKKKADKVVAALKKASYTVDQVKTKELKKYPPPPFITSTLQRTASSVFRWSAKKTMRQAQRLYERGFITYHRTDSVHLSNYAIKRARAYIKSKYGKEYLPEAGRQFKVKSKLAQEAHEAIRPTRIKTADKLKIDKMDRDSQKLFKLIFNRFVACQMNPQLVEKTTVDIKAGNYLLRAQGEVEIFKGWKAVYLIKVEKSLNQIPKLTEGELVQLIKVLAEQKFTQPLSRYTEGSLIKALEEHEIGRPSTYATIIYTIQTRQYVEKIEGFFHPTPVGETVNDFLVKHFDNVVDYAFTAEMENNLDTIAQGKKGWVKVIAAFYKPFAKKLKSVVKNAKRVKIETEKLGKKCPECKKGEQVIRVGRFGKFISCSRFPDCKWKTDYLEKLKGMKCPQCQGDIVVRRTRKGKRFYGCSNWPKCKWASWRKPNNFKEKK